MRHLLLFAMALTVSVAMHAQSINEDFNDGWPDGWTTIDNGDNEGTWTYNDEYGIDGSGCVDLDTWDGDLPNDGAADDWLITPQITVAEGDMLSFYAVCSADYPDEISVMVSKGDAVEEDFTIALEENMELTGDYTKYEWHLTDFPDISEGDDIYVAIHCNSNGSWVDVDNFYLGPTEATLFENFENGFPEDWTTIDGGMNDGTWDTIAGYGLEGSVAAWVDCYDPGPADDWLISPKVTPTEGDYLSFWAEMGYGEYNDTLYVMISHDDPVVDDFTVMVDEIITTTDGIEKFNYDLSEVEGFEYGDEVYFGLHADSEGSQISVDDFRVGAYVPPVFDVAYPASNTEVIAEYDIEVNPGDINLNDITLHSNEEEITFSEFAIDEDNPKKVYFSGASQEMSADTEIDILENSAFDYSVELYAGIMPLSYTSLTYPDGGLEFDGPFATFKGIVTYINAFDERVWLTDEAGAHHSVNTYQSGTSLAEAVSVGDEVLVYGAVSPYENQTEIYPAYYLETLSDGNDMFPATEVTGADIDATIEPDTDPAEMFESVLVKVNDATVEEFTELELDNEDVITVAICSDEDGTFYVGDNLDIYNGTFDESVMDAGSMYSITGILVNKGGKYVLVPRFESDMDESTGVEENQLSSQNFAYPNPVNDVLHITASQDVTHIEIYDLSGKRVLKSELFNEKPINTERLESGAYFIHFYSDNHRVHINRIIKK